MKIQEAINVITNHQKANLKQRSIYSYNYIQKRFEHKFGNYQVESISSDEIYQFLEEQTGGLSKSTRRLRYAQLKTFFNFIIGQFDLNIKNPCSSLTLSKAFKAPPQRAQKILEKETVDEMIYNTKNLRDRLMLEL